MHLARLARKLRGALERGTIESQLVLAVDHFDMDWYVARYPDVAASGFDPLRYYMRHGWREGHWASPTFDTDYYLASNPDVAASGLHPLFHYALHGRGEGRATSADAGADRDQIG